MIFAVPFIPKAVAVTVTVEAAVPVSVTVAIPQVAPGQAPVVTVAVEEPEKLADVLLKVKFTVAPPTSAFVPSLTVAVIVDVLLTVIDDGFAATLTLPPPPPPVIVTWALPFRTADIIHNVSSYGGCVRCRHRNGGRGNKYARRRCRRCRTGHESAATGAVNIGRRACRQQSQQA